MHTINRNNPAELLRLALIGLDARIAELNEMRMQLAALVNEPSAGAVVKAAAAQRKRRNLSDAARAKISAAAKARWARERQANAKEAAPRKRRKLSAAARAKISAAQKARWAKERKGKAEKQKPNAAAKTARAKAKPIEPAPARTKAKKSTAEKDKPTKNNLAKKTLTLQGNEIGKPKTPKPVVNTPAGIVEQMALAGARFRITRGGTLIIGNLGSLPPAVQRMFLDHPNPHLLTAAARRYLVSGAQSSEE